MRALSKKKLIRVKHVRYKNIDDLSPYEKWRIWLSIVQIIATLGVPFVVIALNEYLRSN
jgi:hypothetical protein